MKLIIKAKKGIKVNYSCGTFGDTGDACGKHTY